MLVTVDTGGTKTLIAQFGQDGAIGKTAKFPTPKDPVEYVALVRKTLQQDFSDQPVEALVVALPGTIKEGVALWCNNLGWENFDARSTFADIFADAPILVENDANLAGLAETRILEPTPVSSLYVTIGTGIGTGMITRGHIDPGLARSEGGRIPIEFDGTTQEWEKIASGKAIYALFGKPAQDITDEHAWQQIADRVSRGFLVVIPLIQPDIIIVGGGVGTYFDRFSTKLEAVLREKLPPHIPCPPLQQAEHPEQAVIYGCYYYALDYLASQQATS